jgi:putative endonuclease
MDKENKRSFGSYGEEIALDYLIRNNYKIITKNFRVGRSNEIDIIARDNEYICFIEVKTRSSTYFGMPSESVNKRKQQKIIYMAGIYLMRNNIPEHNVRFDVIELIISKDHDKPELKSINLIKNAFCA